MCVAIEAVIVAGVYFAGIEHGRQAAFKQSSAFKEPSAFKAKTPLMPKPSNGIGVGP
jgi:hypothetical protein